MRVQRGVVYGSAARWQAERMRACERIRAAQCAGDMMVRVIKEKYIAHNVSGKGERDRRERRLGERRGRQKRGGEAGRQACYHARHHARAVPPPRPRVASPRYKVPLTLSAAGGGMVGEAGGACRWQCAGVQVQ